MLALLRRNRDFRRLYAATLVTFCGDWFASVALIGIVLRITGGSGVAASGVFLAATLPQALATVVAGPAADRFDRRRLAVAVNLAQAVAALGFLWVGDGGPGSRLWLAYAVQAVVAFLGAFIGPAVQAGVASIVEPDELPAAQSLLGSAWGSMLAVGASLGGAFTAAFGARAAFLADALTFVASAAILLAVRRPLQGARERPVGRMRPVADTVEALRFAWGHRTVLALLASKLGFGLGGGLVTILPLLATATFGAGDGGTGVLLGARGVGVVVGPLLAGRLARRGIDGILLACGGSALVYAATYATVPVAPTLGAAAVLVGMAHLGGGAQWTLSTLGLQMTVPDQLRGRVLSADFALVSTALALSFPVAGAVAGRIGAGPALVAFASVSAAWGVLYLALTRTLRNPRPVVAAD